ncbi:hypothetical protein AMELA_G00024790 [Ameiurus melas]|uniref:Uncharacterized protein n=1 Tax=Ameiurus melas TaxID=219545 RepID=A0A7J6BCX5_AMEME|nr:hypothetical protein AMELA_G00024790 [Ameiurus melas]
MSLAVNRFSIVLQLGRAWRACALEACPQKGTAELCESFSPSRAFTRESPGDESTNRRLRARLLIKVPQTHWKLHVPSTVR